MFKSLEIIGFKSFADKTRFEFTNGVTVVVGPNGSGKSNVVDAIKWVLGEQKVKSLRGKDSTDVIFNGAVGRKPMNAAEVTLTFDNSGNLFPLPLPEIQITRRLMRSGESEYLLNKQSCRLKDIKDLLSGTGVGTQAYCIIEQGKVDALLQSSPKDRRAIFEEAAGVSRLNIKNLEIQKRLDRTKDNLVRLSDIVQEVERNLKTLKNQAEKANRYREHAQQLKELRTFSGLILWNALSQKIGSHQSDVNALQNQYDTLQNQLSEVETHLRDEERRLADMDADISDREGALSSLREEIATRETNVSHQLLRLEEVERQQKRNRDQAARLSARTTDLYTRRQTLEQEYDQAKIQKGTIGSELEKIQKRLEQQESEFQRLESRKDALQDQSLEKSKAIAALGNEISSLERQLEVKDERRKSDLQRLEDVDHDVAHSRKSRQQAQIQVQASSEERDTFEEKAQELRLQLNDIDDQLQQRKSVLETLCLKRTGLYERIAMLEELQNRHDDLTPGIRDVLQQAQSAPDGPFGGIVGLAAELFQVTEEAAGLIEIALGANAELLVVKKQDDQLLDYLKTAPAELTSRARFVWLDCYWGAAIEPVDLEGCPGVIGRADQFIQTEELYQPLMQRLLGGIWIVETLNDAFSLATTVLEPVTFITLNGERLDADGTLTIGPPQSGAGIIAHRSECQAKKRELEELESKIRKGLSEAKLLEEASAKREKILDTADQQLQKARQKTSEFLTELTALEERYIQTRARREELIRAMVKSDSDQKEMEQALKTAQERKKVCEKERERLDKENDSIQKQEGELRENIAQTRKAATQKRVSLAQGEERCQGFQATLRTNDQDMQALVQDINRTEQLLAESQSEHQNVSMAILSDQSALAELYLEKERSASLLTQRRQERKIVDAARLQFSQSQSQFNRQIQKLGAELHGVEMKKETWERDRQAAADRLKEDYDIQLDALVNQPVRVSDFLLSCLGNDEWAIKIRNKREERDGSGQEDGCNSDGESGNNAPKDDKTVNFDATEETQESVISNADQQDVGDSEESFCIPIDQLPTAIPNELEIQIAKLRKKIASLGSVNMEALNEMEEKEKRYLNLSAKYAEMDYARKEFENLTEKNNEHIRERFLQTIEDVKSRFNNLFSDLFGGGRAQIILDETTDVLEAGVDIVAQPPGKELSNISLLSGGEKTLTCVALLLAMFESHPSPFCILDEVDAALDEANTDRVCQVLKRFQKITQFIAISHSRQTMSIADTIYGVTMQEAGVSKCLSINMEQVVIKDGDISFDAPQSGAA